METVATATATGTTAPATAATATGTTATATAATVTGTTAPATAIITATYNPSARDYCHLTTKIAITSATPTLICPSTTNPYNAL